MLRYTAKIQQALDKGKAEGKVEIYHAWYADWERRKQEALEKDIPFDDPPPPKPEDIKEQT